MKRQSLFFLGIACLSLPVCPLQAGHAQGQPAAGSTGPQKQTPSKPAQPSSRRAAAPPTRSAEAEAADWQAYHALRAQMQKLETGNPQAALELLQKYLRDHEVHPQVKWMFQFTQAEFLYDRLGNAKEALDVLDSALTTVSRQVQQQKAPESRLLLLLGLKGRVLLFNGQVKESETLLRDNWERILRAPKVEGVHALGVSGNAAQMLFGALEQQKASKKEEPGLLTEQMVRAAPLFLAGGRTETQHWPFERLVNLFLERDQAVEALGWARLSYMMAPYDEAAIERATRLLTRAWAAGDNLTSIRTFGEAQENATAANPLKEVKLPLLVTQELPGALGEEVAQLEKEPMLPSNEQMQSDLVGLYILRSEWNKAMQWARRMVRDNPDSPEGARQVARVFKAADLNLVRANAYLAYLQKGEGTNPVTQFLQDHPAKK